MVSDNQGQSRISARSYANRSFQWRMYSRGNMLAQGWKHGARSIESSLTEPYTSTRRAVRMLSASASTISMLSAASAAVIMLGALPDATHWAMYASSL